MYRFHGFAENLDFAKTQNKIFYGNTRKDASKIGFDDNFIYEEFTKDLGSRKIPLIQISKDEAKSVFTLWENKPDKIEY